LDTIKLQLNEMIQSWAGLNLTGIRQRINSIVHDMNDGKYRYLPVIHDSGVSSSSLRSVSVSSIPRPHKDSIPEVPPRSRQSLQSNLHATQHKLSYPIVPTTRPKGNTKHRRITIGTTMSTPPINNGGIPVSSIHTRQLPSRSRQHRRTIGGEHVSLSVERRPSLPVHVQYQPRSSMSEKMTSSNYPPEIVFESSRQNIAKGRHRSQSTTQSSHPPLPPRYHRHSLSPSTTAVYQRFFEPVLDELDEEEETYSKVDPLAYINPRSVIYESDNEDCAPNRRDVEGPPVLANIKARLLKRNSTLKHKKRPIIKKKRSLNDSDDGDSESECAPHQENTRRRRPSLNPRRRASLPRAISHQTSLPKPDRPHRKTFHTFDSGSKLDILPAPTGNIDNKFNNSVPSSEGENEVLPKDASKKVIIRLHSIP